MSAKNRIGIVLLIVVVLIVGWSAAHRGTGSDEMGDTATTSPLLGSEWQWSDTSYNDGRIITPQPTAPFILKLDGDMHLSVTGDCNAIGGEFTLGDNSRLMVGPLIATKMFCEGSLENDFTDGLSSAEFYTIRGDTLSLTLKDNEGFMNFTRYAGVPAQ